MYNVLLNHISAVAFCQCANRGVWKRRFRTTNTFKTTLYHCRGHRKDIKEENGNCIELSECLLLWQYHRTILCWCASMQYFWLQDNLGIFFPFLWSKNLLSSSVSHTMCWPWDNTSELDLRRMFNSQEGQNGTAMRSYYHIRILCLKKKFQPTVLFIDPGAPLPKMVK